MVLVAAGLLGAAWWVARNHEADVFVVSSAAAVDAPAAPRSAVVDAQAPHTESVAASHTRHAVQPLRERGMPFTITGVVVDVDGLPAAGVEVAVRNSEHVVSAFSDPEGRFRLVSWESTQEAQVVLVACDGEPDDAPQSVAWGSENVRLVWRRGLRLEVMVRQAGVGTPLAGCEVRRACDRRRGRGTPRDRGDPALHVDARVAQRWLG